ncbi:Roundabout 1 [Blomia tropicalis]|nr:Roundabout 1 [Blomia tropicalis]
MGPRPPIIKEHPTSMVVKKQKPVTLSCKADGEPTPTIEWYKDNELVHKSPNYIFLANGDLFILKVTNQKKEKDTGIYHCMARNEHGKARSHNATIEIASIRDEFRILPTDVWAAVGDVAVLECSPPRGYPEPEVKWKKSGEIVQIDGGRFRLSANNLIISDVQPEDAGRYHCLAQNMGGLRESPPAQLNVRVKPYFIRRPEDVTALSNEVAEIHCKVGGDPTPKVTWKRERGKIPSGRSFITDDKSIRISHVTLEDEGVYVCEAENLVGQISSSASLIVHSKPNFLVEPKDVRTNINGVARFECVATGNPRPSVFWTKEGNQVLMFPDNKYGRFSVNSDGSLIISSVKKDDIGFYVCSALSVVGSSTAKAFLNISSPTEIPPPLIILGPADQTLAEHTTAILPCDATGTPHPSLRWLLNNNPIPMNNDRFNILETGTLQIDDLQLTDSGNYQCVVYSDNGQSNWSAQLRVVSAHSTNTMFHRMPDPSTFPDPPSRPMIVNSTDSSVTISWRRTGRDGASPFISAIVEYFSPEHHNEWIRIGQPIMTDHFTIQGLSSASRYFFLVRAQNSHGIGPPSPISHEARTLGTEFSAAITSENIDLIEARKKLESVIVELKDVRAINSSTVKLFWEVRGSQEYVEGFYVRFRTVDHDHLVSDGGPTIAENKYQMVTVYNGGASTYLLTNLPKYNIFEFFLVPFYKTIDGKPSNTRIVRTMEDYPSAPPSLIKAKPISSTSALVSWQPPPPDKVNGQLLGYKLFVEGSYVPYSLNLTINSNTTSYLLRNLSIETEYVITMLAFTAMGHGPSSSPLTFIMDPLLSSDVYTEKSPFDTSYMSNVWICVLIITLIILSLIVLLLGFLLYKKRTSILKKGNTDLSNGREMKSATNSLYPSQWQYSWKTGNRHASGDSKQMVLNSGSMKISSSFHPLDHTGYSTVTTDEPTADYAEVSQADNNYETAYYATSNAIQHESPIAYASSSIISAKNNVYATQAWPSQNWTVQMQSPKAKAHPFSTLDRSGGPISKLYFADRKKGPVTDGHRNGTAQTMAHTMQHKQQVQPLIGSCNDYEDASLFYADSSAYSANVTQIPSSKLVGGNQFKYGSLSRVVTKANQSHLNNPMISNELKASIVADSYGKKKSQNQFDWETRDFAFNTQSSSSSPRNTLSRNKSRTQMEIESTYKPTGHNRHLITNPMIERANVANYQQRSPSFDDKVEDFTLTGHLPSGGNLIGSNFFSIKDSRPFNFSTPVGTESVIANHNLNSCDNESNCYQELP